jgi:hypothetical protein
MMFGPSPFGRAITYLTHLVVGVLESARSARQHKARGVSPGNQSARITKPAERATDLVTAFSPRTFHLRLTTLHIGTIRGNACRPLRGLDTFAVQVLGLTPQALCCRPLRGLW